MKTEYNLSKHRFYELKHFCLQYLEWKHLYLELDGWYDESGKNRGDTTSRDGIRRADIKKNVEMIEECAGLVGNDILRFVTEDKIVLPIEKRYEYRKFFWELSRRRT
jgi:hypothetical protein